MATRLSRMLQGPHHEVWKQFALDVGGKYHDGEGNTHVEVRYVVHGRDVVLQRDVNMVMIGKMFVPTLSTRFVVNLPSVAAHRFSISAAAFGSFGSAMARWFGAQDISVGDATFDEAMVLKGVDPVFVQQMFDDAALRALCIGSAFGSLQRREDNVLWSDPTPGLDPLELSVPGFVDDLPMLRSYSDLFTAVLARQPEVTTA